VYPKLFSEEA